MSPQKGPEGSLPTTIFYKGYVSFRGSLAWDMWKAFGSIIAPLQKQKKQQLDLEP